MKHFLLVFLGGGIGSGFRFLISKFLNPYFSSFFLGTFSVNIIGCFLIGLILGIATKSAALNNTFLVFLTIGFCGGFTTFSSFALENYGMLREGQIFSFLIYTLSSILAGILAVAMGLWLVKLLS
ncbi:MAG: fluoride efflux transporter CrcB [Flavobacteriaceae bacterium]|nr:fluoride efflux transporter CrcB [Muriicola sp.]NNC61872.1 fluoride efflux transporter CrcB [Eudoraea sp.]NNK21195.1 fluoride efflux transporter CrcB [Flavobacteriaceae bacterium]MBT8290128.1 fluoride efflux transporter CrcB [Muriicola sp.]NNK35322.1 fluoride efflux transporter CrcB [Eudoraea sp.]